MPKIDHFRLNKHRSGGLVPLPPQYALEFNGDGDYIETSYNPNETDLGSGFDLEMIAYYDSDYRDYHGSWGAPRFYFGYNEGVFRYAIGDSWADHGFVPVHQWMRQKITFDGSTARIFVHDVELGSMSCSFSGTNSNAFYIGRVNGFTHNFGGKISYFCLKDSSDNKIIEYKIDEGKGSTVFDHSGNGNHGTIVGAKWIILEDDPLES